MHFHSWKFIWKWWWPFGLGLNVLNWVTHSPPLHAKSSAEPMLTYQLGPKEQPLVKQSKYKNFHSRQCKIFSQGNVFQNVFCMLSAILSQPQCVLMAAIPLSNLYHWQTEFSFSWRRSAIYLREITRMSPFIDSEELGIKQRQINYWFRHMQLNSWGSRPKFRALTQYEDVILPEWEIPL